MRFPSTLTPWVRTQGVSSILSAAPHDVARCMADRQDRTLLEAFGCTREPGKLPCSVVCVRQHSAGMTLGLHAPPLECHWGYGPAPTRVRGLGCDSGSCVGGQGRFTLPGLRNRGCVRSTQVASEWSAFQELCITARALTPCNGSSYGQDASEISLLLASKQITRAGWEPARNSSMETNPESCSWWYRHGSFHRQHLFTLQSWKLSLLLWREWCLASRPCADHGRAQLPDCSVAK
jgi:hypothetical protein